MLDFINDLRTALPLNLEELLKRSDYLKGKDFMIYDYELDRNLHYYEHIIYLAAGYCRTSFLPLMAFG